MTGKIGRLRVLALALACAACASRQANRAEVAVAAEALVVQHDAYVFEDALLAPRTKDQYLRQSMELRILVRAQADLDPAAFHALADPLVERCQTYVANDPYLDDPQRRESRRNCELVLSFR